MKKMYLLFLITAHAAINITNISAQLTPQEAIKQMSRGINIGNTLEPPNGEGTWNNPALQEYYFDDYKAAGFKCVRIPITWGGHTSGASPYTINGNWLNRVEQIVDWGLSRKLIIIINAHHESWLKDNPTQANKDRFDSIWSQISVRFKDKSDSLLFEMINEPYPMTKVNVDALNERVLGIIRKTNPTRIVVFSGDRWSGCNEMVQASVPDDDYLIGYFHSYDPYLFGLEAQVTWGTPADVNEISAIFDKAKTWSDNHNIPVLIGEFGAISQYTKDNVLYIKDFNSRMFHYATYVEQSMKHNIAYCAWDDGGDFKIYQRADRNWNEIKDIITNFTPESPTNLTGQKASGTSIKVSWTNRTSSNDSIFILRGGFASTKNKVASLKSDVSEFIDEKPLTGKYNYYRVVAHFNNENDTDLISYPIRVSSEFLTSIKSVDQSDIIVGYPNPADDFLQVNLPAGESIKVIQIFTLQGKLVSEMQTASEENKIPLKNLENGVYFVKIGTSKSVYTKKIIKR